MFVRQEREIKSDKKMHKNRIREHERTESAKNNREYF
jgi:hypothetical protein